MKQTLCCLFTFLLLSIPQYSWGKTTPKFAMVIHGGASTITREKMSPEKEALYRTTMNNVLQIGYDILKKGGTAMDAAESTIRIMEDSPLFNAGKGAVFTDTGTNELDASIMDGSNLLAGAVAGVKTVKNPISAARKVMEETWHVLLAGQGADHFAKEAGLEIVDPSYFSIKKSYNEISKNTEQKHDTVGCVVLDKYGNLAAGTSTGGLSNKRWGRIGDSPIIGAGTYANNKTCAISCTGEGEFFIRGNIAYDISALMEYRRMSVDRAVQKVINKLTDRGGTGGLIALDHRGNIAMSFNTPGMYRGYILDNGNPEILFFDK